VVECDTFPPLASELAVTCNWEVPFGVNALLAVLPFPAQAAMAPTTRSIKLANATPFRKFFERFSSNSTSPLNRPNTMATLAKSGPGRLDGVSGTIGAPTLVSATVLTVSLAVTAFPSGVTDAALNAQLANDGRLLHEKVSGVVNEPSGVIVKVKSPFDHQ
jgi:hypothetical protein